MMYPVAVNESLCDSSRCGRHLPFIGVSTAFY